MGVPDLKQFGRRFRELRTSRGITQDEVLKRSAVYGDVRSLRKFENGDVRPRRKAIVDLLYDALIERDPAIYDELLTLAGYRILSIEEKTALGLSAAEQPVPQPARVVQPSVRWFWRGIILAGLSSALPLGWHLAGFDWLCAVLYSALFGLSVLLESAHEFRGGVTIEAAAAAFSLVLPFSVRAIRTEDLGVGDRQPDRLLYAMMLVVAAAALQWAAVRPALPPYTIVESRFQSHTAQAAHFKNTGYFLLLAFLFWLPPHYCGQAMRLHVDAGFCPPPLALWIALAVLIAATVPMGSHLLDNLQPTSHHNLYVILFWTRAFVSFLLSTLSLLWYSIGSS